MYVKEYYPAARGAVWQAVHTNRGGKGNCMVLFSNTGVDDNPTYQTCLFEGEIKSLEKLKKYYRKLLNCSNLPLFFFSLSLGNYANKETNPGHLAGRNIYDLYRSHIICKSLKYLYHNH